MIRKLNLIQTGELIKLRESGMGYQMVEADEKSGFYTKRKKFIILNSQLVIDDSPQIINEVKQVFRSGFNKVLLQSQGVELKNFRLCESLNNLRSNFSAISNTGAKHQKLEKANGSEEFYRLSAYENDFRIDTVNKRLIEGSYTTTKLDYFTCKFLEHDPVDRYALPNDEIIKFVFEIKPTTNDYLQRGKVEPEFGHKGGGAEVLFERGTSINTYIRKFDY